MSRTFFRTLFSSACLSAAIASSVLSSGCSNAGDAEDDQSAMTVKDTSALKIQLEASFDPQKKYRLVSYWFQIDDDGPDPAPSLAFDVAFDPTATSLVLPEIAPPTEPNLWCARTSEDEMASPCESDSPYRIGLASIFIAEDVDGDGKFTWNPAGRFDKSNGEFGSIVLFAYGDLVYSEKGVDVLPKLSNGASHVIDGEIPQGVHFFEAYTPESAEFNPSFDRLRISSPTSTIVFRKEGANLA